MLVLAVSSLTVPSCDVDFVIDFPSPGVTATPDGGVQILPPACFTEITGVSVSQASGRTLWRITAEPGVEAAPVTVGVTPDGFVERIPLSEPLPQQLSIVVLGMTGEDPSFGTTQVSSSNLATDSILVGSRSVDLAEFAATSCA